MHRWARGTVFVGIVVGACSPGAASNREQERAGQSSQASQASQAAQEAARQIRGDKIMPAIRFLASPRLEGREAGERGAEIAADYLVSRFQAAGLQPGSKEGFLQRFDLVRRILAPEAELTLTRTTGGGTASRTLELRTDWMPFNFSEVGTIDAPVVFAGYGIVAPEHGWNDYAALGPNGARGKVVVVFRHEPDEEGTAGNKFFDGREMTLHASLRQKARVAIERGAAGLIVVDDPLNHEAVPNPSSSLSRWTVLTDEQRQLPLDDPKRPRGRAGIELEDRPLGIVAALASQEVLRWVDGTRDWKALQRELDSSRKSKSFALPDVTLRVVHRFEETRHSTSNVVALLPGSDPELSKEYVVIGGHYDHLGNDDERGRLYPGADDNASGTAVVVAAADAFAALPQAPARSLLFVAWGAEEMGLLGSAYFVRKPPVPVDRMVAAINLDMVGRNKETEISIVGRSETPDLAEIFDRLAPAVGFTLNDDAGAGASRSDNASMWLGGVPTVSLFSGTHEDYHEPGDTADRVLPGKIERVARLTFLAAHELASEAATPKRLEVPAGPWTAISPSASAGAGQGASR